MTRSDPKNQVYVEGRQLAADAETVTTEQLHTESRAASVVVHEDDNGNVVADGPTGQLASANKISTTLSDLDSQVSKGTEIKIKRPNSGDQYNWDSLVTWTTPECTWRGTRRHAPKFFLEGGAETRMLYIDYTGDGCRFDQLKFIGNKQNQTNNHHVIEVSANPNGMKFTDIHIKDSSNQGIHSKVKATKIYNSAIVTSEFHGVWLRRGETRVQSNHIGNNGNAGVLVATEGDLQILDNKIINNGWGVDINGASGCTISRNYHERNTNCLRERSGSGADNNIISLNDWRDDDSSTPTLNGSGTRLYNNKPRHYDLDETITGIAGGGTSLSSAISRAALGDDIEITVVPNADPNNDLAFDARVYWDDSAGAVKVQVEETANAGGGDARVTAKLA